MSFYRHGLARLQNKTLAYCEPLNKSRETKKNANIARLMTYAYYNFLIRL